MAATPPRSRDDSREAVVGEAAVAGATTLDVSRMSQLEDAPGCLPVDVGTLVRDDELPAPGSAESEDPIAAPPAEGGDAAANEDDDEVEEVATDGATTETTVLDSAAAGATDVDEAAAGALETDEATAGAADTDVAVVGDSSVVV